MQMVCKHVFEPVSQHTVTFFRRGFKILSVAAQHDKIAIWAIEDPEEVVRSRIDVVVLMTGQEYKDFYKLKFLGTCSFDNGEFILHVFTSEEM